jgi:hypothetical protein
LLCHTAVRTGKGSLSTWSDRSSYLGGCDDATWQKSFARFCAVFRESVKKIRCRSAAAGRTGHGRRVPGFPPRSVGSARTRSRAIPPTPRPRGRLSVLAFLAPAQRSRGGESAAVSSRADYDGGARRGARLTRLLARRERRCPARRGRRAGLARVEPTREFEPFVAAAASHAGSRSRARAASGSRVRRAGAAPSSISGRRTTRSEPLRWPPWPSHLVVALPPDGRESQRECGWTYHREAQPRPGHSIRSFS